MFLRPVCHHGVCMCVCGPVCHLGVCMCECARACVVCVGARVLCGNVPTPSARHRMNEARSLIHPRSLIHSLVPRDAGHWAGWESSARLDACWNAGTHSFALSLLHSFAAGVLGHSNLGSEIEHSNLGSEIELWRVKLHS